MRKTEQILEEYLVASARLGDRVALSRLVSIRGPRLLAHAGRLLGDAEDARDVVQEAWIDIVKGLGSLRDDRAFVAWANQIVTRKCARVIRNHQARRTLADEVACAPAAPFADAAAAAADAGTVRAAIRALPRDQPATMALFYLEDMSVRDVARSLDIPVGTVKTRLMHARAKLRSSLNGGSDEQTR